MAKPKTKPAKVVSSAKSGTNWLAYAPYLVLLITALVFWPSLSNRFVNLDDPQYVLENPVVKEISADHLRAIFTEQFVGNYQPLTMLSYMIDHSLFGLDPFGYHLVNILLHLANTILVFMIAEKLAASLRLKEVRWMGLVTALLFGIHPLHVESVAWISERKDVLYGFFFLLGLHQYISSTKDGKSLSYKDTSLLLLWFLLSLMAKAQAVVLPVIFLAIDFLLGRPFKRSTLLEKIPFFALAVVFGLVAVQVQGKAGAMQTFEYFPIHERLLFSAYALMTYLYKMILPVNLSCFYPYPETNDKINTVWVYLAPGVLLLLGILIWQLTKSSKYERDTKNTKSNPQTLFRIFRTDSLFEGSRVVLFGVFFFLITIALVLQLLPIGDALYADRYTYIPSIGLFFIAGYYLAPKMHDRTWLILILIPIGWYSWLAHQRVKCWSDSLTLYSDALDNGYKAAILYNNRGAVLADSGKNELALQDFDSLVALKPKYPNGWRHKALLHERLKQEEAALAAFGKAVEYHPEDYSNFLSRGTIYVRRNEFDKAIADFTRIIELQPNSGEGYYARSEAYGKGGRLKEALADINKAIELNPENAQAYNNRGIIHSMSAMYAEAVSDFTRSLELKPDNLNAYTNRGLALKSLGKYAEALKDMLTAKEKGHPVDDKVILELQQAAGATP